MAAFPRIVGTGNGLEPGATRKRAALLEIPLTISDSTVSLRCLVNGADLHAFLLSAECWSEMQRNHRKRDLRMPCCGSVAVPKVNRLGVRYFAHQRRSGCTAPAYEPKHLLAREQLARTAIEAGWQVTTEASVHAPDEDAAVMVDVLARSQTGACVAFRIQWHPQPDEVRASNARLAAAGIRAVWLQRLPRGRTFHARLYPELLPEESGCAVFGIRYDSQDQRFDVPRYELPLNEFVLGVLEDELGWGPEPGDAIVAGVVVDRRQCWNCDAPMGVVLGFTIRTPQGQQLDFHRFTQPGTPEYILSVLPPAIYDEYGIGPIKRRRSRVRDGLVCMSNGCPECDLIYGNWYVMDTRINELGELDLPEPVHQTTTVVGEPGSPAIPVGWRFRGRLGSHRN